MVATPTEREPLVLLVDDNPGNLHALIQILTEQRYRVLVAESGKSALERLCYATPDIILLDVLMPHMNGFETCKKLKENPATADIPIIFLTALSEMVDKIQGFDVGGVDYITKPIQIPEVLARLNTHLALRRLQQTLQHQNEQLAEHIQERTAQLQCEMERRKRQELEKQKLLDVLGKQSEQLRMLTGWLVAEHQQRQSVLMDTATLQVEQNVEVALNHVAIIESLIHSTVDTVDGRQVASNLENLRSTLEQIKIQSQTSSCMRPRSLMEQVKVKDNPLLKLSNREREVLQLVVDGKSNTEIAEALYLSETTVRTHRSRILHKLDLNDTTALIKFAIKHQLTSV
ncbi:MAG: response regulator [Caldilineaceae bacterium]|nr:response regulator [Caldilineaceae bacterium]